MTELAVDERLSPEEATKQEEPSSPMVASSPEDAAEEAAEAAPELPAGEEAAPPPEIAPATEQEHSPPSASDQATRSRAAEPGENGGIVEKDAENPSDSAVAPPESKTSSSKKKKEEREVNPKFKDVQETGKWGSVSAVEMYVAICACMLIVIGIAVGVGVAVANSDSGDVIKEAPTRSPTMAPTAITAETQLKLAIESIDGSDFTYFYLQDLPENVDFYQGKMDDASATPQQRAMSWLLFEDDRDLTDEVSLRWAMASLYYSLGGESWTSSEGWLSGKDICEWEFVDCDAIQKTLREIDLSSNNLVGSIPNDVALLGSDIRSIWMRSNKLTGTIPGDAFGSLPRLTILYLDNNQLTGTVPLSLRHNGVLSTLYVQSNDLTGEWPREFCPTSAAAAKPVANSGLDCDEVACLAGCCDEYSCYYDN